MTDAPAPLAADLEKFAQNEYNSVTQIFSSGLQAMAVLLTLFFIFTGAMLNYVGGLFTDMGKKEIHAITFWGADFRILQIYGIVAVGAVLTAWSLCFVLVFRDIAGRLFQRASEVEELYPDVSSRHPKRLFTNLHEWYNATQSRWWRGWWRRGLYVTTIAFYVLMAFCYVGVLLSAIAVHKWPSTFQ